MKPCRSGVIAVLLSFLFLTGAGGELPPIVWYVHGMVLEKESHTLPLEKLRQIFPNAQRVELVEWNAPPIDNKLKIGVY